jgi:hypothetical protein
MFKSWAYYFNGLEKTQWYGELFAMTTEVEPAYYYRYAQSLRSIGEMTKQIRLWKSLIKFLEMTVGRTFAKKRKLHGCH